MKNASRLQDKWDQVVSDGRKHWVADVRQVWTRNGVMTGVVTLSDGQKARVAYVRDCTWLQYPL